MSDEEYEKFLQRENIPLNIMSELDVGAADLVEHYFRSKCDNVGNWDAWPRLWADVCILIQEVFGE